MSWKTTVDVFCDKCNESFDDENDVIYCYECYDKLKDEKDEFENRVEELEAEIETLKEKIAMTGGLQSE